MEDEQWIDLYGYLVAALRERGYSEVVQEIEQAATERIIEQLNENETSRRRARTVDDLETARIRPQNPREIFESALGVLRTRLLEVPLLAGALQHNFEREREDIRWEQDIVPQALRETSSRFSLTDLSLSPDDRAQLVRRFDVLHSMMDGVR